MMCASAPLDFHYPDASTATEKVLRAPTTTATTISTTTNCPATFKPTAPRNGGRPVSANLGARILYTSDAASLNYTPDSTLLRGADIRTALDRPRRPVALANVVAPWPNNGE